MRMLERRDQMLARERERAEIKIEAQFDQKAWNTAKKESRKVERTSQDVFQEHYSPIRKY